MAVTLLPAFAIPAVAALEAALASALNQRLKPRGRWFTPIFVAAVETTSAAPALLARVQIG
jgi:hypothetical protein